MGSTRMVIRGNWLRALLLGVLAIGMAGCATVQVSGPTTAGHTFSAAFAQAREISSMTIA